MGRKEGKIRGRKKREKQVRKQGRERGDSMRGKERGEERRKGEKSYSQSLPCTIYNNLPEVNHKLKYKAKTLKLLEGNIIENLCDLG